MSLQLASPLATVCIKPGYIPTQEVQVGAAHRSRRFYKLRSVCVYNGPSIFAGSESADLTKRGSEIFYGGKKVTLLLMGAV